LVYDLSIKISAKKGGIVVKCDPGDDEVIPLTDNLKGDEQKFRNLIGEILGRWFQKNVCG